MARKWRVEYAGAVYHVINRGNYRAWVFREAGARDAFEACLFEAAERYGWVLHAWVVMGNHYHLAVETPAPNLVAGMQWLQSVYANRFNRYRGENGQLFQGRFKALFRQRQTHFLLSDNYTSLLREGCWGGSDSSLPACL